jgi:3-oxoadipate enol-lactonase
MRVLVAGRAIHYDAAGAGLPLLLLHPFPLDARIFAPQLGGLPARVIAPDLSGAGRSDVPPDPATYSVDRWAEEALAVLDAAGVERAIVAGVSMGGYVALALVRRAPQRVAALALCDTRAGPDGDEARARRTAQQDRIRAGELPAVLDGLLPALLAPGSSHAAAVRALMAQQPAAGVMGALQALRDRPDARPGLAAITAPTVVIGGELDAITPPAELAELARAIPGARLVPIPGAGHLACLEAPPALAAALEPFLRGVPC